MSRAKLSSARPPRCVRCIPHDKSHTTNCSRTPVWKVGSSSGTQPEHLFKRTSPLLNDVTILSLRTRNRRASQVPVLLAPPLLRFCQHASSRIQKRPGPTNQGRSEYLP